MHKVLTLTDQWNESATSNIGNTPTTRKAHIKDEASLSVKGISVSVPMVKSKTGAIAFHFCALFLWNNFPLSVRSAISVATFEKHLKTHVFDLGFPQ